MSPVDSRIERSPLLQNQRQLRLSETILQPDLRRAEGLSRKSEMFVNGTQQEVLPRRNTLLGAKASAKPATAPAEKGKFLKGLWGWVKKHPILSAATALIAGYTLTWLIAPIWFAYVHAMLFLYGTLSLFFLALAKRLLGPAETPAR
jgi:hypothetical protein